MKEKRKKCTSIGGQAVLEGVMMRGQKSMAMAVRDADGEIQVETTRLKKRSKINKVPILRGVINFFESMVTGIKITLRSAEVYGEDIEPSRFEKWLSSKFKINIMSVISTISVVLGLALAVGLFILLPQLCTNGISSLTGLAKTSIWYNLIEGCIRMLIFVLYVWVISLMSDIKRLYKYHGAEHKTITCYERGFDLTVSNAKRCSRLHDRCGTTFMVIVMIISIVIFSIANSFLAPLYVGNSVADFFIRFGIKICLLPFVAGFSYETLKLLAKTQSPLVKPLKAPGLAVQLLTTKEPDDEMLEVAIAAFNAVLIMDSDESVPERKFITAEKLDVLLARVKSEFAEKNIDESDAEWICSMALGIKRSELGNDILATPKQVKKVNGWMKKRLSGRPLWYIVGNCDFYGIELDVDERVLIPRPETEQLVEEVLKDTTANSKVLDLCTGSGAIAITIAKERGAKVTAVDISEGALQLAEENAQKNDVEIEFIHSDMFANVSGKYDIIVSNPPYIKTNDIKFLQSEVKDFEPKMALDGGEDGLDFYRAIAILVQNYLTEKGELFLECGIGQAEKVAEMLKNFSNVSIINDLNGVARIIKAVL